MATSITADINTILTKIQRTHPSVAVVILSDRTGLTIARVARLLVKETLGDYDLESIGAIGSAVFMGASEQGNTLSLGLLELMIAEFGEGKILTSQCGPNGILIVVTDDSTQLGLVRVQIREASKQLGGLMTDIQSQDDRPFLDKDAESKSIMEALKELENFG